MAGMTCHTKVDNSQYPLGRPDYK
ncbi:hypothetical protein PSEUDO8O_150433 [Pseudomonas sp. 8O]|nr:hypothetical protein PSEUDO8O_150433 [Pseudomonas sp. 8O]